jgi:hypothetical protein
MNLKDHHFDKPEKRPEPDPEKVKAKPNMNKRFKDYNIVSNKYLEHHDAKVKTDEEVQKSEAAQKYWKTHDFDPISCNYYDASKEDKFLCDRVE